MTVHESGQFVRHPRASEWGMGFVRRVLSDGTIEVVFSRGGERKLSIKSLPTDLEVLGKGKDFAVRYHKERLEALGLPYRGIRQASLRGEHRVTHCYACKRPLDNAYDIECVGCGWILCECTACGCDHPYGRKI